MIELTQAVVCGKMMSEHNRLPAAGMGYGRYGAGKHFVTYLRHSMTIGLLSCPILANLLKKRGGEHDKIRGL